MSKVPIQMLAQCILAASIGIGINLQRGVLPLFQEWSKNQHKKSDNDAVRYIEIEEMRNIVEKKTEIIFDARPSDLFDAGHVGGAISLPAGQFYEQFPHVQLLLRMDSNIIVYCSGLRCNDSLVLAHLLQGQGYTNISVFEGGYEAWLSNKLLVEYGN